MSKFLYIASAVLSVVVLLVVGGVMASTLPGNEQVTSTNNNAIQPAQQITDPNLQQAILQRESAYQAAINEANLRLQQANEAQRKLEEQLQVQQQAMGGQAQPIVSTSISAEQAAQIAQIAVGSTPLKTPELVSLMGQPSYEVVFQQGKAYVDMNGVITSWQPTISVPAQGASIPIRGENEENDNHKED